MGPTGGMTWLACHSKAQPDFLCVQCWCGRDVTDGASQHQAEHRLQAQAPSHRRQQGMKCKAGSASGLQGQAHISSFRVALQMREKPPLNKAFQGLFFPLGKAFWIKKRGRYTCVCVYIRICIYLYMHT